VTAAKPRTPPRRRRLRRTAGLLLALAVLGLGLGAHGLAWRWATEALAVGFADWAALRRVQGWTVDHGAPGRAGWPFAAEIILPGLRIGARDESGRAWRLDAARAALRLAPPRPDRLQIRLDGPHRMVIGAVEVPFTATRLEALVSLDAGGPPRAAELLVEGLGAETPDGLLVAGRALVSVTVGVEPAFRVTVAAERVSLPERARVPAVAAFGQEIDRLALDAAMSGPPVQGFGAAAWRAWRDAGGLLEVRGAALRWGPLDGEARLTLWLDAALQPAGDGMLRLTDPAAALAALEAAGLVASGQARAARGVLPLLARAPAQGGAPEVQVPVALSEGRISAARIPLIRLAPLAWPDLSPR
jgi:hypothetical protein